MTEWGALIPLAVFLLVGLLAWRFQETEQRRLEEFADANKVVHYDEVDQLLPQKLRALLPDSLEVRYCFAGPRHGEFCLCFEYARGWGRNRRWLSVVAVQQLHPRWMTEKTPIGYRFATNEGWIMLYPPGAFAGRIRLQKVAKWWDRMRTATIEEAAAYQEKVKALTDVVIRPRHES